MMGVSRAAGEVSAEHLRRGLPFAIGVGIRAVRTLDAVAPPLHAVEEAALGPRAIEQRRRIFALGRAAARDALAEFGIHNAAIPRADGGEPVWPDGFVGSITHSREVAIAIVGRRDDYAGLGVDIEELARGPSPRAARLVCRPNEMAWVDPESGTERLARLFSAKEAVFKAVYPIERVWLGFADAELTWREDHQVFEAELLKSVGQRYPVGFVLSVNSVLGATWVLSSAYLPAPAE
ncbi:MAG: 4'-phosphopantetheinyl transferase superfamily protein [Chloroflexi bacterium]|nr:4'-phosphopantetheinyl transferase superfamily protein [Chloroflexota bacterium]